MNIEVPPSCPACDDTAVAAVEHWVFARGRTAMACRACGFLFTHPRPSAEELQQYYGSDGTWQSTHAAKHAAAKTRKKRAAPALMSVLDRFFPATRPRPGARVLDFGCGAGAWLNAFQDQGWVTYGIEPSTDVPFVRHKRLTSVPADGRVDTLAVHRDLPYILRPPAHISAYTEACLWGLMSSCGLEPVAALHELDGTFSKGAPVRLRLVAQKAGPPSAHPSPTAALVPVLEAVKELL